MCFNYVTCVLLFLYNYCSTSFFFLSFAMDEHVILRDGEALIVVGYKENIAN